MTSMHLKKACSKKSKYEQSSVANRKGVRVNFRGLGPFSVLNLVFESSLAGVDTDCQDL